MDLEYAKYLLEKTRQDYNLIAGDFSRTRNSIWPETRTLFDKYLFGKEKVLDLGCGNGRYFEYLKEKNVDYFGVDNSERLIEIARKKYGDGKFQVADALCIQFPANFFDKVVSIAVLHHIPSGELRLQFLKEARRVLEPGGFLILAVWNLWQKKTSWSLLFKYTSLRLFGKSKLDFRDILVPWKDSQGKIKVQRYIHCFTGKELKKLAQKAGFKIKEIRSLRRSTGHFNLLLIAEK